MAQGDYVAAAVAQALQMIGDGADMLDVGGESSRPGAVPVPAEEETRRVVPVIAALRGRGVTIPIAVDTVKASVAEAALRAGASIVNDITALRGDRDMASAVARHGAEVVLMHNRADASSLAQSAVVGGEYSAPDYTNVVDDVVRDLAASAEAAQKAGIARNKIMLDPGIGFGKTVAQNLALINHLEHLKVLGYPVLVGPSRKSFIGRVLDVPVEERLEGTAAAVAVCVLRGADILRVHDVKAMVRVAKMAVAIAGA
jgi:dihydropteroate synthase